MKELWATVRKENMDMQSPANKNVKDLAKENERKNPLCIRK